MQKANDVLLIGLLVVVGALALSEAMREDWSFDPFGLTEKDGFLYGRGTATIWRSLSCAVVAVS